MRLEQLTYLIEISLTKSISLASKNLHISQQSLSKAIQNLEDELEVTLLERSSKGVALTKAGKTTVTKAKKIFQDLDDLKTSLKPLNQKPSHSMHGSLGIFYTNTFDLELLQQALKQFSSVYPNITVSVNLIAMTNLFTAIIEGEVDLGLVALTNDYSVNKSLLGHVLDKLNFFPLTEDRLLVAVSNLSPLAKNKSVSIRSVLKYPLLMLQHDSHDSLENNWLDALLKLYGTPHYALHTNDSQLYLQTIADNLGIGFFTTTTEKSAHYMIPPDLVLLPLRESIRLFSNYVLSYERPLSLEAQAFLPFLTGTTGKDIDKEQGEL